jgi:hypothetical protein
MIVSVDFDGTICSGLDFNIEQKIPNTHLIEQINYLRRAGNYIKIVTARGSFNSTLQERSIKYLDPIRAFLEKNGVEYDMISFNKEFADIYIDDLAIRPDEVVVTKDLSSGFTKNVVTRLNNMVIKTGETVDREYLWYEAYQNKDDLPVIINRTRHSIVYKYVEPLGELNYEQLLIKIGVYKSYPRLSPLEFGDYIESIIEHLQNNSRIKKGQILKLLDALYTVNGLVPGTFAHGDLSIDNIIPVQDGFRFIDPLYHEEKFGSYLLDYAKLLLSLKFYRGDCDTFDMIREDLNIPFIDILIAAEAVRVSTYKKQFSFIAENLINEL